MGSAHGALSLLSNRLVKGNLDSFRHTLERLDRRAYFDDGYYGRCLNGAALNLIDNRVLAPTAVEARALPGALEGVAAPPRSNGEMVFSAPWEARAFAMAVALTEAGVLPWLQLQAALVDRISRWEAAPHQGGDWCYYEHWLFALEDVLGAPETGFGDEVGERARDLSQRPGGHDHPEAPR